MTEVNRTGSALIFSTFLGGPGDDEGTGIALDAANNVYVAGKAGLGFPIPSTIDTSALQGTFPVKLSSSGSTLIYWQSSAGPAYYNSAPAIAVDSTGNAYVTGAGAFGYVNAYNTTGSVLATFPLKIRKAASVCRRAWEMQPGCEVGAQFWVWWGSLSGNSGFR